MERQTDLTEIIEHIDPSECDYQEWINVGMALKHEGYSVSVWDEWSRRDAGRYHAQECEKKWHSFHGNVSPVTAGTVVQMALDRGWRSSYGGRELDWDDTISVENRVLVNRGRVDDKEVREPEEWNPAEQLIKYLEILFEASEKVGYVTRTYERDGRFLPSKGCWDRTAGQLIQQLSKCGNDVGAVLGDYNPQAGAWIRFNPLDGKDCKNENVTEFKYALVESDTMEIEKQNSIIRELELPVACLVHSGGKSLHAVVRVEASDHKEYRNRVDYLYKVCEKNGLKVDGQNRNPSRLSRMPGVIRNGKKQFLVDTDLGKKSWDEWYEWIEGVNDDLPEPERLEDVWNHLPELSGPLINNVLRKGHKMLISGPSKAGKSFALIELSIAIAEGIKWLRWECTGGKVLYVNLELDRASCLHRFRDVYEAMGLSPKHLDNIDIWNLRGKAVPMDNLAPKLIRRAAKKNYIAIIIDPIYKVITGDENSADQMANFCNQFDKVCTELEAAVIYCHHHSKGSQGGKRAMDRASGSGVFARDPDAILDLIELDISEELLKQQSNNAVCDVCADYLNSLYDNWEDDVSQDDMCSQVRMKEYCKKKLFKKQQGELEERIRQTEHRERTKTAWRIEGTLREFPKFDPVNLWFDYPVHRIDRIGVLKDIQPEAEKAYWQKKKKSPQERKKEKEESLRFAFEANDIDGTDCVKLSDLSKHMGVAINTVKKYVDESKEFKRENGMVSRCQK